MQTWNTLVNFRHKKKKNINCNNYNTVVCYTLQISKSSTQYQICIMKFQVRLINTEHLEQLNYCKGKECFQFLNKSLETNRIIKRMRLPQTHNIFVQLTTIGIKQLWDVKKLQLKTTTELYENSKP